MAYPYRVISGDGHLEIPPEMWTTHVPKEWRDRAPRTVKLPTGGDGIVMEGRDTYVLGLAMGGKPYDEEQPSSSIFEEVFISPRKGDQAKECIELWQSMSRPCVPKPSKSSSAPT